MFEISRDDCILGIWPRDYKTNSMLYLAEHEIVGILTFKSRKIAFYAYMSLKNAEFCDIFIPMNI